MHLSRSQTWGEMCKYSFVLSPFGNGYDCHRTWEALLLGCIPIMKKSRIDSLFKYLPVLTREDVHNPQWIADVKDAGLIYFSGGDPVHLADTFRDTPLWSAILSAWKSGASLAGCSAGAMAFGGKIIVLVVVGVYR
jgi:hypothetical protein